MSAASLGLVPAPVSVDLLPGTFLLQGEHQLRRRIDRTLSGEEYVLDVYDRGVAIRAGGNAGLFYGFQTLLQLLPPERLARARRSLADELRTGGPVELPRVHIEDEPAYPWRGFMLDVARHFFPAPFILKLIDQLAAHKLNVLHLHLTDDQGWRIPIPGYPKLTEVGGWRPETLVGFDHEREDIELDGQPHGGAYTRAELEEIVAYAAARFIEVVPEVDLPGHSTAAVASYPEFGNGAPADVRQRWGISTRILNVEDATLAFVDDVMAEVADIFPSLWIHGGGDEVPKKEWRESPAVQARIAELGLGTEVALQGWFTGRIDEMVRRHGRRLVAWDEVVEADAPDDTLVMAWRSTAYGVAAVRAGYDVVMSPSEYVYLDHRQSTNEDEPVTFPASSLPLITVFEFEPTPLELRTDRRPEHGSVLGGQANLWTEYVPTPTHAEYMAFPRVCAFAEAVWRPALRPGESRDFADFHARLSRHTERLIAEDIAFRRFETSTPELELLQRPERGGQDSACRL
jgi:hexosaminidase